MKTLVLLRHAKSSWDNPALEDHERPLNARGREACSAIGAAARMIGLKPDLVLSSSAVRTRETVERVAGEAGWSCDIRYEHGLYLCGHDTVLRHIRAVAEGISSLVVVAHNPDLHWLSLRLSGCDPLDTSHADTVSGDVARMAAKFPTGAMAVFGVGAGPWTALASAQCGLRHFITPKDQPGNG